MKEHSSARGSMMSGRKRTSSNVPFTSGEPESKKYGPHSTNGHSSQGILSNNERNSLPSTQPIVEDDMDDDLPATQQSCVSELEQSLWSAPTVAEKLEEIGQYRAAEIFREQNITGNVLDMMTEEKLNRMGIDKSGDRLEILKLIRGMSEPLTKKVFNDSVHGHIELHPLCVKIVDTPQFQRLRYLKQLGACYFVYPGAAHNRFEHCLGVCHLAGKLTRHLRKSQPELEITKRDVLCVEIAGLCHDLGHGPFSHMFDGKFIPRVRPDKKWKHEDGSVAMFDHMLEENNLRDEFAKYRLDDQDITFIKEQIAGPLKESENEWPYHGREQRKSFLYEIVANKRNGIDVDKWDYFARDCHGLGIKNNFDHLRFLKFSRVIKVDDSLQICSRDKEVDAVYSMFQIRATLHRRAYQHRVCNAIEIMITDAFIMADNKKIVPGKDGKLVKISECIDDPVAFTYLNDSMFHTILMSTDEDLAESRAILNRIQKRQLYKCVGETTPTQNKTKDDTDVIKREIVCNIPEDCKDKLQEHDIVVHLVYLDYGMKAQNPIKNVRFYNKNDVTKAVPLDKDQVSLMLPTVFAEQLIRLYCKKTDDESIRIATQCFQQWCDDKGMLSKQDSLTPEKWGSDSMVTPEKKEPTTPVSAGKFKQRLSY